MQIIFQRIGNYIGDKRNNTTTLIRKSKISFYNKLNDKLNDVLLGPKKWWGIVKQLYGSKIQSSVPALLENNCIITDAKEKATLLNEYFSSQCKIPDLDAPIPNTRVFQISKSLGKITTTCETEVINLHEKLEYCKGKRGGWYRKFPLKNMRKCYSTVAVQIF